MAAIASPYGMRPVQLQGGLPYAGSIRSFLLTVNPPANKAFFFGDPVGLSGGQPQVLAASPSNAAVSVNSPIGIFMGAEWQDPIRGFVNAQMLPANAITAGATQVKLKILDSPMAVFKIQAAGSVPATAVGLNIDLLGFGTGTVATGDSLVSAAAAAAVTATLPLKIIGFPYSPTSVPGDAFTDLYVIWNAGVHRYTVQAGL